MDKLQEDIEVRKVERFYLGVKEPVVKEHWEEKKDDRMRIEILSLDLINYLAWVRHYYKSGEFEYTTGRLEEVSIDVLHEQYRIVWIIVDFTTKLA